MNVKNKAGNLLLGKQAEQAQLKQYFTKVFELAELGKEFPISLDDVWPLVYNRKEEAVRALKQGNMFTEGFDYQVLRRNAEQKTGSGGHNKLKYMLSVSCMEYLIVKKVRPVFEVYRKVFHRAAKQIKSEQNSIDDIQSQINKKGYIDARDIPYTTTKLNEKKVTTVKVGNTILFCINDLTFATKSYTRASRLAKILNIRSKNAVKVHVFGRGIMWFTSEIGKQLIMARAGVLNQKQLQLNFGGQS